MIGETFGEFTIEGLAARVGGKKQYLCLCSCGNYRIVDAYKLKSGVSKSCGCKKAAYIAAARTTHDGRLTLLYTKWCGMKRRCLNKNDTHYMAYGGRGITVCSEWVTDFAAFRTWALANGYDDTLTIERRDVDKGYSPGNCTWLPTAEQAWNKRNTVKIWYKGERMALGAVVKAENMSYKALSSRYYRFLQRNPLVNVTEINFDMLIPR